MGICQFCGADCTVQHTKKNVTIFDPDGVPLVRWSRDQNNKLLRISIVSDEERQSPEESHQKGCQCAFELLCYVPQRWNQIQIKRHGAVRTFGCWFQQREWILEQGRCPYIPFLGVWLPKVECSGVDDYANHEIHFVFSSKGRDGGTVSDCKRNGGTAKHAWENGMETTTVPPAVW